MQDPWHTYKNDTLCVNSSFLSTLHAIFSPKDFLVYLLTYKFKILDLEILKGS